MPQATQVASGAAVADARCIGQPMKAASNAAFADEVCTTQTTSLASGDLINSAV